MKKSELKNLIKECVIELFRDGELFVSSKPERQSVAEQHGLQQSRHERRADPTEARRMIAEKTQVDTRTFTKDPMLAQMIADTAASGVDLTPTISYSESAEIEKVSSANLGAVDTGFDPMQLVGSDRWARVFEIVEKAGTKID